MPQLIGPAPLSPFKRTATGLGCVLDGITDNSTLLNAWLATASASNPIVLEIDGPCAVYNLTISPAGYTTIIGVGSNAVLFHLGAASGSTLQDNLIRLGPYLGTTSSSTAPEPGMDPGPPAPAIVARNVTIANLRMDGNYNANRVDFYRALIDITGCANFTMRDCTIENNPWYGLRLGNCNGFRIIGNRFYPIAETTSGTASTSQDGCHINGSCYHGVITGNLFHSVDDAIALNAPEGFGLSIYNVAITGNEFFDCPTWVRAYVAATVVGSTLSRIMIAGNSGTALAAGMIIGNTATSGTYGKMTGISFVGNEISAPYIALVSDNIQLHIGPNEWSGGVGGAIKTYTGTNQSSNAFTLEHITVDGLQIIRTPTSMAQTSIIDDSTAAISYPGLSARSGSLTIRRAVVRNVTVVDVGFAPGATSASAPLTVFATQAGTTVVNAVVSNLDATYVTTIGTGAGTINNNAVFGAPPLTMQMPDAIMANSVPYLSIALGAPAIKLNGVPQLLSPSGETSITSATTAIPTNVELVTVTLTGNYSPTLAAGYPGQNLALQFVQDSTGGRTVTYPSTVLGGAVVATGAGKRSQQVFTYSGSQNAWIAQSAGVVGY